MLARYMSSLCLSVHPLQAGIVPKWLNADVTARVLLNFWLIWVNQARKQTIWNLPSKDLGEISTSSPTAAPDRIRWIQIGDFQPIPRYMPETVQNRGIYSYFGRLSGTRMHSIERYYFHWIDCCLNVVYWSSGASCRRHLVVLWRWTIPDVTFSCGFMLSVHWLANRLAHCRLYLLL